MDTSSRRTQFIRSPWVPVVVWLLAWGTVGSGQNFSPYSAFLAMSLEELKTLQVKLTYVGPQQDVVPTVAFTSTFNTLNLALFVPFRRPGFSYANDNLAVQSFSASPAELQQVVQQVGTLPDVTAGAASGDFLSFAMLNTAGGTKAFEAVLDKPDSLALFNKLRLALQSNAAGLRLISEMACSLELLEAERPTDVSGQVAVSISGVRLNRTTGRYVATANIKNNGASLTGPVSLVVDLGGSVALFNHHGTTCGTSPVGRRFVNLSLTGNTLPSGGSLSMTLEFENPNNEPVVATTKVLAGPGAR